MLKLYAMVYHEGTKSIVNKKWVFDLPSDGIVTLKITGDKVLDPVLVVNQEEYSSDDDPLKRSGVQQFLRKVSRLGFACVKALPRVPALPRVLNRLKANMQFVQFVME